MVYFDKSWKNILTSALNNDRCSPVCVPLCRRSRRGVTPTCGRLARRSKTLRRTSGMDSNSCCCWRSSQVTPLYDLESVKSTENEAQRSDFFNTCLWWFLSSGLVFSWRQRCTTYLSGPVCLGLQFLAAARSRRLKTLLEQPVIDLWFLTRSSRGSQCLVAGCSRQTAPISILDNHFNCWHPIM